jgi:hypothetical protein
MCEDLPDRARLRNERDALPSKQPARFPTFHGGGVLVDAERLKDVLHGWEDETPTGRRGDSRRTG